VVDPKEGVVVVVEGTSDLSASGSPYMFMLENLTYLDLFVRSFQPISDHLYLSSFEPLPSIICPWTVVRFDWGYIIHDVHRTHQSVNLKLSLARVRVAPTVLLGRIQPSSKVCLEEAVVVTDDLDYEAL